MMYSGESGRVSEMYCVFDHGAFVNMESDKASVDTRCNQFLSLIPRVLQHAASTVTPRKLSVSLLVVFKISLKRIDAIKCVGHQQYQSKSQPGKCSAVSSSKLPSTLRQSTLTDPHNPTA